MTYFLTIDEMTEESLEAELQSRKNQRARGVCDYCGRTPDTKPCKFPTRHQDKRIRRET